MSNSPTRSRLEREGIADVDETGTTPDVAGSDSTGAALSAETVLERCGECGEETEHGVSIDLVTESDKDRNVEYSREPYRVTECTVCGTRESRRMNDA